VRGEKAVWEADVVLADIRQRRALDGVHRVDFTAGLATTN